MFKGYAWFGEIYSKNDLVRKDHGMTGLPAYISWIDAMAIV
jgi:hypothetical protein